jgi:alpha-beta hydrolase superfamily lysophospholipase
MRGGLPHANRLLDDLGDLVESTRVRNPGVPLVVIGHSMGGLVAASFVARTLRAVDGLVLSSPALALRLSPVQRMLMSVVPRLAPNLAVNGLDPQYLSHDKRVVQAYRTTPGCTTASPADWPASLAEEEDWCGPARPRGTCPPC